MTEKWFRLREEDILTMTNPLIVRQKEERNKFSTEKATYYGIYSIAVMKKLSAVEITFCSKWNVEGRKIVLCSVLHLLFTFMLHV